MTDERHKELELPPVEEVERALDLEQADRDAIPGLYNLNVNRVPVSRLLGVQALLLFVLAHMAIRRGAVPWGEFMVLAAGLEVYAVAQLVVIRRYFTRFRRFHLGTAFLVGDIGVFTVLIHATGTHESWLWPLYILRVADQMWIGRRRAGVMLALGAAAYGLLLVYAGVVEGEAFRLGPELFKIAALLGMGAYLVAIAGLPWNLQERTEEAMGLILRLEDQSLELEREREKAEEASRAKTEFLSRMSHELRTPLNSVVGFSNSLLRLAGREIGPKETDFLDRIRQSGMHLLALINDILDIAHIDDGRIQIQVTQVDLEAIVRDTVGQLDERRSEASVPVSVAFPRQMKPLPADEARIRQVLINLLGNAMKFTHQGWIRVEVEADPESGIPQKLHVVDTGIGIAPDRLEAIFEAFEQADGSMARSFGGTGLGLTISRRLCRLMGFELYAESSVGEGSRFTVDFTAAASGPEAAQPVGSRP